MDDEARAAQITAMMDRIRGRSRRSATMRMTGTMLGKQGTWSSGP